MPSDDITQGLLLCWSFGRITRVSNIDSFGKSQNESRGMSMLRLGELQMLFCSKTSAEANDSPLPQNNNLVQIIVMKFFCHAGICSCFRNDV